MNKFFSTPLLSIKRPGLYSNAFYLICNNMTASLLGFIFWNVMARCFTTAEVGVGSALVAASTLIAGFANLGMGIGLIRYLPESGMKPERLMNTAFSLVCVTAAGGSLIYIAGLQHWSSALCFIRQDFFLCLMFVTFSVVASLSVLTDQSLIAGRSAHYVLIKNTVISLLKLPAALLVFAGLKGYGIFAGVGASTAFGLLLSWRRFLPAVYRGYSPRPQMSADVLKKVFPYSFGNYLAGLFNTLPGLIYPLMVLSALGPEKNAYFFVSWMMTMVIWLIPGGLAQSFLAEGSNNRLNKGGSVYRALAWSFAICVPAAVAMMLLGGWFLKFFGPGYAESGAPVVRYLSLSTIPQCVNVMFFTVNQLEKKVHLLVAQALFISTVSLILGWGLMERSGLPGIGVAYLTAQALTAFLVFIPLMNSQSVLSGNKGKFTECHGGVNH
ncbi:MAG: hypothetical protein JL50_20980 [Peptococcaceae bacterium BICA1-7]|nr:MAG: hypothetical protein JL50_20980 [Peptococcaceae bacterium BICA1-7]HBV98558.1 lipopolysaccharide biosynthesis protein [Desulfotomaculum sp.]